MNANEQIEATKAKVQALKKKTMNVRSPQAAIIHKLLKNQAKWIPKENSDKKTILELIDMVGGNQTLKLISNKFDSPNIISSVISKYKVKSLFISTWAVTPIGIDRLKKISDLGVKVLVLLDKTHSYKWVFESGAYKICENVEFIFTENHSKFIIFDIENDAPLNFIGSFNLSNNPRYENCEINRSVQEFEFYRDFLLSVKNGTNEIQGNLF